MTYAELIAKIRSYTEVDSTVLSDAVCDDFIRDAELRIARAVDADYLRKFATSSFVASSKYVLLPNDIMIVRSVQHISGGTRTFLENRETSFLNEYNSDGSTGTPKYWGNWYKTNDKNYLIVAPAPSAADTVEVSYIRTPPHLFSSNDAATVPERSTSTFLSTFAEELLLYACLIEAYSFLKGPMDMYNLYEKKYNESIQNFAIEQTGRRRRGEYTDGVPRVKIPSPSP
jgi:hypothetical protein